MEDNGSLISFHIDGKVVISDFTSAFGSLFPAYSGFPGGFSDDCSGSFPCDFFGGLPGPRLGT